jgi:hypothetical protein
MILMSYSQKETKRRIVFSLGTLAFSMSGLLIQYVGQVPVNEKSNSLVSQAAHMASTKFEHAPVAGGKQKPNEPVLLVIQQPPVKASTREHHSRRVLKTNVVALIVPGNDNTVVKSYMAKFPGVRLLSANQIPSNWEQVQETRFVNSGVSGRIYQSLDR